MLNTAINPEVMILDEPTSGLDAIASTTCWNTGFAGRKQRNDDHYFFPSSERIRKDL